MDWNSVLETFLYRKSWHWVMVTNNVVPVCYICKIHQKIKYDFTLKFTLKLFNFKTTLGVLMELESWACLCFRFKNYTSNILLYNDKKITLPQRNFDVNSKLPNVIKQHFKSCNSFPTLLLMDINGGDYRTWKCISKYVIILKYIGNSWKLQL